MKLLKVIVLLVSVIFVLDFKLIAKESAILSQFLLLVKSSLQGEHVSLLRVIISKQINQSKLMMRVPTLVRKVQVLQL